MPLSLSIPAENIRKPEVFGCFQGVSKETSGMKWVNAQCPTHVHWDVASSICKLSGSLVVPILLGLCRGETKELTGIANQLIEFSLSFFEASTVIFEQINMLCICLRMNNWLNDWMNVSELICIRAISSCWR